uniref:TERF1-interacting nuclear factor 2 N-terminal domain-containing protein n=1 Tax=Cynoglossus semilaevis TaxID=244447 RepID=A0A3P8UVR8_CYNSE
PGTPILQTVAPLVRLLSAALWKVMKQRDVMQYGVLEKFVTSACETVPGMLTFRHQGKLTLGLRGRVILFLNYGILNNPIIVLQLILELCRTQPDAEVIEPHLQRMRAPTAHSSIAAGVVTFVFKAPLTRLIMLPLQYFYMFFLFR